MMMTDEHQLDALTMPPYFQPHNSIAIHPHDSTKFQLPCGALLRLHGNSIAQRFGPLVLAGGSGRVDFGQRRSHSYSLEPVAAATTTTKPTKPTTT